jgi:replicative DNA helicase
MSVESLVIAALVEEGSPKKAFQQGLTREDFPSYDEEWQWLCENTERGRPINWRRFKNSFPDFEAIVPSERTQDLVEELRNETAYFTLNSAVESVAEALSPENVFEQAEFLREKIGELLRMSGHQSDVLLTADWKAHLKEIKHLATLREAGIAPGISSGFKNLDHHYGGWMPGRVSLVLGRPGDAKSFFIAYSACEAFMEGRRVAIFSPEMNEFEHRARVGTILSAKQKVQEELNLTQAFRNRALMEGHGFNIKTYKRFLQYMEERPGEIILFTQKYRRRKMTPAFIESRIDDLGIEMAIIDPIYKLKSPDKRQLKHQEIEDLIDQIQDIAKGYNIPILVSNQARRQERGGRGDAPHKDDSFQSDAPVHEADHVIGIKHFEDEKKIMLRCSKNRFGKNFRVDVDFHPNIGKMDDITPIRGSYFNGKDDGVSREEIQEKIQEIEAREKGKSTRVKAKGKS